MWVTRTEWSTQPFLNTYCAPSMAMNVIASHSDTEPARLVVVSHFTEGNTEANSKDTHLGLTTHKWLMLEAQGPWGGKLGLPTCTWGWGQLSLGTAAGQMVESLGFVSLTPPSSPFRLSSLWLCPHLPSLLGRRNET